MAVAVVHKTILEKQGPIWPKDNSLSTSILEHIERMKVCDETVTVGTTFFFFFFWHNILMRLILISPFYRCGNCGSET